MQFKLQYGYRIIAARNMTRLAAFKIDQGYGEATYSAMAKRYATDVGFNVAMKLYKYLVDMGIFRISPWRNVRDVRVHQILEGTNEKIR